jgi:hypothetical protein
MTGALHCFQPLFGVGVALHCTRPATSPTASKPQASFRVEFWFSNCIRKHFRKIRYKSITQFAGPRRQRRTQSHFVPEACRAGRKFRERVILMRPGGRIESTVCRYPAACECSFAPMRPLPGPLMTRPRTVLNLYLNGGSASAEYPLLCSSNDRPPFIKVSRHTWERGLP